MHKKKLEYVHPAPVRIWHWINAARFVLLILTGFQIRFAELLNIMSLQEAIKLHNYVGFAVIANYLLWLYYYLGSGKISIYIPDLRTLPANAIRQIKIYWRS